MSTTSSFEMQVNDIFQLSVGRTVFVGEITGSNYVKKCECIIKVPGENDVAVSIDGEDIPCGKKNDLRAISTRDKLDIEHLRKFAGLLRIIGK
jgi:hypothetical protein